MDFYSRNNLLPLNECFPFSRAVEPWVFYVQGLGSGGVWEIACTPCSRVKNKNKSAFSQTEKSHQHPETDRDGPKEQAPSCAALLGGKGGCCCCPTPAVISWLAGGGRKHFADEAAFLWQKIIPQSWYPAAFGETATGFHLSKPCPKLFSLSPVALQCKNDSPSPKIPGNGRFRMCIKQTKKSFIY